MKVLLATTNIAKIKYFKRRLEKQNIEVITLKELNIDTDVKEVGDTPIENAVSKAKGYYQKFYKIVK